ncbi:ArsR/SmtB family transcription factor [Marinobacter sp.]|uniref:ArsR/SmtB family transcription factor n=1 Tax=Marinobacter sp. TaxID=50741 RepID=UPI00384C013A
MTHDQNNERLTRAFKALSNPNRLQIYQEIVHKQISEVSNSGCRVVDFINAMRVGAPTISHHLKELVNAELIRVERNGKFVICHLNESMREELKGFFG